MKNQLILSKEQMNTLRELGITRNPKLGSGFTAQELIKILPKTIDGDYVLTIICDKPVEVSYFDEVENKILVIFSSNNILTALYQMVVWERNNPT